MLKVVGNEHTLDEVKMPSECLHIFKSPEDKPRPVYDHVWVIGTIGSTRTARLVRKAEAEKFVDGEYQSVIPAYRK